MSGFQVLSRCATVVITTPSASSRISWSETSLRQVMSLKIQVMSLKIMKGKRGHTVSSSPGRDHHPARQLPHILIRNFPER